MGRKQRGSARDPKPFDIDRTLEDLDGERWGEPNYDSYVVRTCHALRKKPLRSLTDEELRLALSQSISLRFLIPLALDRLEQDPFRPGDFYPGDMLANLMRIKTEDWPDGRDHLLRAGALALRALARAAPDGETLESDDRVRAACADFLARQEAGGLTGRH